MGEKIVANTHAGILSLASGIFPTDQFFIRLLHTSARCSYFNLSRRSSLYNCGNSSSLAITSGL